MAESHVWEFKPRFRRKAFGWRSQPAIQRLKQAVAEIKKVARKNPVLAAEGAVLLIERVSPALEQVDSSSGAIGSTVNNAIAQLVPIIASAPVEERTRAAWLERLFEASANDQIPYIEILPEYWGELCGSKALASAWADQLVDLVRMMWSDAPNVYGHFHGTEACLSALLYAGRNEELLALLELDRRRNWIYQRWGVKALAALGRTQEAIESAETCRGPWASSSSLALVCEEMLLAAGRSDEAYRRYAFEANRGSTYLATFRAIVKKYPQRDPRAILADLVKNTPGEEGKWFAAARAAGLLEIALKLAESSPCDPHTLARAARDHADSDPLFAVGVGLAALRWIAEGFGYEIMAVDVQRVCSDTLKAAGNAGNLEKTTARIRILATSSAPGAGFLAQSLRQFPIA